MPTTGNNEFDLSLLKNISASHRALLPLTTSSMLLARPIKRRPILHTCTSVRQAKHIAKSLTASQGQFTQRKVHHVLQ
ncbi:hypothetical protein FHS30_000052 [Simiduia aestuariiviva]|uniref:Uncharacterized protein n=1 Tax=Simiduia aestuariiviva TaxID=1510459 RepID=A0A839UMB0_9GAMM|nr:hypothetical protein [Simiduia aestuariiviva]